MEPEEIYFRNLRAMNPDEELVAQINRVDSELAKSAKSAEPQVRKRRIVFRKRKHGKTR